MRTIGLPLWCLLVAASAFAQNVSNDPPDTIFYNGKVITVDSGFSIQQAFAVKGDVYVIEANPNPWLSSGAEFAMAARKAGKTYNQLISEIVDLARARYTNGG